MMLKAIVSTAIAAGICCCGFGFGSSASAQVVQLPTVAITSVATTVSVPDRGGTHLGGIYRSRRGRTERGVGRGPLLSSRGAGRETSAGGISAHARIIDNDELDRSVLAEARRRIDARGGVDWRMEKPKLTGKAAHISRHVARGSRIDSVRKIRDEERMDEKASNVLRNAKTPSVAELRRRNALAREERSSEAVAYYEKAKTAYTQGKKGAAKIYLQMAHRRATGEYKSKIASALAVLTAKKPRPGKSKPGKASVAKQPKQPKARVASR